MCDVENSKFGELYQAVIAQCGLSFLRNRRGNIWFSLWGLSNNKLV